MNAQTPELQSHLSNLRLKSLNGTITMEEMREAIRLLREGRKSTLEATAKARTKKAATPGRSADELLGDLGL